MRPLVSVILPVYNGEKYIAQAIQSVLKQTYQQIELLIVNDGSTDGTERIVKQFADPLIRYFTQKNAGVSAARNTALAHMKGDYFCCLDSDDVLPENSILSRMEVFNRSSSISFVDGPVQVYEASLQHQLYKWSPQQEGYVFHELVRLTGKCFFGPTWMVKVRHGVTYHFEMGLTHGEDLLFYISIANSGLYAHTNECVLQYRKNEHSAMNNLTGLGTGYAVLASRLVETQGDLFTRWDRLLFHLKVRKIMFLSFCTNRDYRKAFEYVILGQTKG
jgi:glycosyltransferase involved in cell wall biosynthesis